MSAILDRAPAPPRRVDLHSNHARRNLTQMVIRLFGHWGISMQDQAVLLGQSPRSRATLNRYRQGTPMADNQDLLERAGHLLGIHKSLRILYPHNRDLAYRWITTPNRRFGNRAPIEVMKEGFLGLVAVRRYLDFERGN